MDLSILRLKDPVLRSGPGERRRSIRHKLHTPVYASFNGPHSGMVLDLSELLDLSEDGFAVQTGEPLEINRAVNVCLDLPETKNYIHATGHVVWSDGEGRGGIRLAQLADQARQYLKEWLLVNLLIACSNHAARAGQLTKHVDDALPQLVPDARSAGHEPVPVSVSPEPAPDLPAPAPVPDLSAMLSAIEAVRREVRALEGNFEGALQLIAERALSLTGATGAALAFMTTDQMTCRARAGDPAPPLGAHVDAQRGLSGECVRTGQLILCEDSESDPRVDREICRRLGIRSILAAPIVCDFKVVGLIEVFSSKPYAFPKTQETALESLVEIVPKQPLAAAGPRTALELSPTAEAPAAQPATGGPQEPSAVTQEHLTGVGVRRIHLVLMVLAVAIAALAIGYVLAPTIESHWLRKTGEAPASVAVAAASPEPAKDSLERLRSAAEAGDVAAQYELGFRYDKGDGVPKDDAEAVHWFQLAAQQGHVVAQGTLGYFYWAGRGVRQDINKAYFWSVLARAGGNEASKYLVDSMAAQMTPAQARAIQKEADQWLQQHTANVQQSQK